MSIIKPKDFIKIIVKIIDCFTITRLQNSENSCINWNYDYPFITNLGTFSINPEDAFTNNKIVLKTTPRFKKQNIYSIKYNKNFETYIQILFIQIFDELNYDSTKTINDLKDNIIKKDGILKFILDDKYVFISKNEEDLFNKIFNGYFQHKLIFIKEMLIITNDQLSRVHDEFINFESIIIMKFIYILSRFIYNHVKISYQSINLFELHDSINILYDFNLISFTTKTKISINNLFQKSEKIKNSTIKDTKKIIMDEIKGEKEVKNGDEKEVKGEDKINDKITILTLEENKTSNLTHQDFLQHLVSTPPSTFQYTKINELMKTLEPSDSEDDSENDSECYLDEDDEDNEDNE
jgi:hypothetical protein